jgi:hypothetical protein
MPLHANVLSEEANTKYTNGTGRDAPTQSFKIPTKASYEYVFLLITLVT